MTKIAPKICYLVLAHYGFVVFSFMAIFNFRKKLYQLDSVYVLSFAHLNVNLKVYILFICISQILLEASLNIAICLLKVLLRDFEGSARFMTDAICLFQDDSRQILCQALCRLMLPQG